MPDNASQTKFDKSNYKLYCVLFITNLFLSSLLGLLIAQFLVIQSSIKELPVFLTNGNNLFINSNNFIQNNEPLVNDVLKSVLINSRQFNKTLLEINKAIDITQPKILNLINNTENQLIKIDDLLNDNLNQLIDINRSIKQIPDNNIVSPSVDQTPSPTLDPTIPNLSP